MTIHGTTICAVRKDGKVAIAGDGQATSGEGGIVMKGNCRKVRRLYDGRIIIGFAGATADASAAGKSSTSDAAGDVIDYLGRFELAGDIGRTVGALDPAHRARLSAALAFACRPAAAVLDLTDAFVRGLSQDEAFAFLRLLAHIASEERAAVLVGTTDSAVARVVTRAFALDIDSAELLNANDPSAGSDGVSGAYI